MYEDDFLEAQYEDRYGYPELDEVDYGCPELDNNE